jgi:hypothetical protein
VVLEAVKSQKMINQFAQEEGVLVVQVRGWKKELQERIPEVLPSGAKERREAENRRAGLAIKRHPPHFSTALSIPGLFR